MAIRSTCHRIGRLERRRAAANKPAAAMAGARLYHDGIPLPADMSPADRDFAMFYVSVLESLDLDWFDYDNPAPLTVDDLRR